MDRTYPSRSLHGQVVHELGLRIVRGDYAPGSTLPNEEELATSMDVSRTALREAVKVLSAKGLIESRPKVGTRVRARLSWNLLDPDVLAWRCNTMQSDEFARNLMEMREIVEPAAAALAARHQDRERLAAIDAGLNDMADATDLQGWVKGDLRFHQAILQATGNELLMPLGALIETALETLLVMSARSAGDYKGSLPRHQLVRDAIRDGNEVAAREAMQALLADSRHNLIGGR